MVQQDSRTVALRNILTRLSKRSGLSADRLRTTEIDVAPLLDLAAVRERAQQENRQPEHVVLPVVRDLARQLDPTNRLIADAELSLGLLRDDPPTGVDVERLYAADLGERREYLSEHWRLLHEAMRADTIPDAPTVRSLRATPERRAFTALAGLLVSASVFSSSGSGYRFTPEPKPRVALLKSQSRRGAVTVIGDAVIDHIYRIDHIPAPGESTPGSFETHAGGKGLSRAVAAARLGLRVRLISAVGEDDAGRYILNYLRAENVGTELVKVVPGAQTKVTAVMITGSGVSSRIGCTDDRMRLGATDSRDAELLDAIASSDAILLTFEQPTETIVGVLDAIRKMNPRPSLIVHPAPPLDSPQYLYEYLDVVDYLVGSPWELERMLPTDSNSSRTGIAQRLRGLGVRTVCVIEGFECTVRSDEFNGVISDFPVALKDSPGAPAAFSAALASQIVGPLRPADEDAFRWATAAMVLTQSFGDVPDAMPSVREVDRIVHMAAEESAGG